MKNSLLMETPLFRDMTEDEIEKTLHGLNAVEREYEKGEVVLRAGEPTERMCGEKTINATNTNDIVGSPPRVRGKGTSRLLNRCKKR
ncbi:MAG: hypothetical protein J5449_00865, partial [Oscillospiraceae bacterium]|nr:hypothetical protein [Oscillospiraceae bacterium]